MFVLGGHVGLFSGAIMLVFWEYKKQATEKYSQQFTKSWCFFLPTQSQIVISPPTAQCGQMNGKL